ncbi:MAG: hypothetical protein IPM74_02555 [Crocinitomicaceae bacterium]|nr:hypothetical protein [Crocinitomicaceae bacterium]MBK8924796.1 hypothetical protein [Crocinitomicaceae bacterium]
MTEEERQKYLKELAKKRKEALKNKAAALKFLKQLGILTKKGNLKSPYKEVCIPEEAA